MEEGEGRYEYYTGSEEGACVCVLSRHHIIIKREHTNIIKHRDRGTRGKVHNTHSHTLTHTLTYTHTRTYTHTHTYTHTLTHTNTYTHTHTHIHAHN